jgi:YD repeat-containing protein
MLKEKSMTEKEAPLMRSLTRSLILAILVLFPISAFGQVLQVSGIEPWSTSFPQTLYVWLTSTQPVSVSFDASANSVSAYQSEGLADAWLGYVPLYPNGWGFSFVVPPYCDNSGNCANGIAATFLTPGTKTLYFDINGAGPVSVQFYLAPDANAANLGVCKQCALLAGMPINLADGNVYIQQRDYSVPGLGGGLALARTWNSRLLDAGPPSVAGMFGQSWRSTYEESLAFPYGQTLMYWRGDGSAWTFTYNSVLSSYSLTSPPDERAQLVSNLTGGFTLTLADGTQKVFNGQDLLAAIIDRNHNQTTLAYDSSNRLTSVTSPGGSTLTFTYGDPNNPSQATTAQDSVGTVATYTYDSASRLTKVTYPDSSAFNYSIDPYSSMILSVTDSQGKLLESHTYNGVRQGLTSARAYGVDSVSLSY